MVSIAGVKFRGSGKVYYFDPAGLEFHSGAHVIVETAHGVEMGTAAGEIRQISEEELAQPLKPVLRVATPEDEAHAEMNRQKEREAFVICKEKIRAHDLEMKLIDTEYTFDNNKILFYFTADGRVDFRELVKDLASVFRTRIELRQIGVRDETKILGGIGICGRPLCCSTWLTDFVPVSIRMAKEQNLSLNPTKISGTCGRLMCCLKNEEETYEYLNSILPSVGDSVTTATGLEGTVTSVSVLRRKVRVKVDVDSETQIQEYDVSELTFKPRKKKERKGAPDKTASEQAGQEKDLREKNGQEKEEEPEAGEQQEAPKREKRSRRRGRRSGSSGSGEEQTADGLPEVSENSAGEEPVHPEENLAENGQEGQTDKETGGRSSRSRNRRRKKRENRTEQSRPAGNES